MASNASQDSNDENDISIISSIENSEKLSQLEIEIDALTQENSELFVLLQNERKKSKLLQNELELGGLQKKFSEDDDESANPSKAGGASETSEGFLQNVVLMLKEKLESKESECEDLEDKLSVMNQELANQGEELARATLEFQHQIARLHELLAQERDLNSLLSEESDQTVQELQTKIQEKNDINTELKVIQDETSERMQNIEDECRFYQTKLRDTETRLRRITSEHEQQVPAMETESVSCQVSESELHAFQKRERESNENDLLRVIFAAMWEDADIEVSGLRNANRYKIDIFKSIRNGFRKLRGKLIV
jgi:DNA repair exonuclease SbcCD ATPase subunit